jgi:phosphoribosylformylglycinamidine (FGAM) synthase-like enzyme
VGCVTDTVTIEELFSEFPGRFIVATSDAARLQERAAAADVPLRHLAVARGDVVTIGDAISCSLETLRQTRDHSLTRELAVTP